MTTRHKTLVVEPVLSPGCTVVRHLPSGHHLQVLLVGGTEAQLVEAGHGDHEEKRELGKVAQGRFEVVPVAELHRVPSLNGRIKHHP